MKIKKAYKLEEACSTDPSRFGIAEPWIDASGTVASYIGESGPMAIATDGRMLAIVPVELGEQDKGNRIAIKALKESRKAGGSKCETAYVTIGETASVATGGASYPVTEYTPPKLDCIIPKQDRPCVAKISLDASLLLRLAKALGGNLDRVSIEISDSKSPIIVRPCGNHKNDGGKGYGLLMPVNA
jgi:hypothetical protein